jgi:O-6-methylguanine DNA methyltransferase
MWRVSELPPFHGGKFRDVATAAAGRIYQGGRLDRRLLLTVGVDDLKGRLPQSKLCREGAQAVAAVKRYFEGEETDFSGFRLDLGEQDPFFERVYAAARHVGWGHTTTYGALAMELGAGPEAARDVGQAVARNPVALIIPCHADHPLPQGLGGRRQGWRFFRAGRFGG